MDLGVLLFPTDQTIDPVELAREARNPRLRITLVP